MNCKKCGKENIDNSIYCSNCGYRLDGKKKCVSCSQMIEENAIYCNFCGSRVDGKSVCKNCGSVYDGEFCTQCGTSKSAKAVSTVKNNNEGKKVFNKIVNIVAPCLVLVALLLLFINSFLLEITVFSEAEEYENKKSIFYFFGKIYEETALSFKGYQKDINLPVAKLGAYLPIVLGTIVFAVNILISFITLTVASIKTGTSIYKNKTVNNTKYLAISFSAFLVAVVFLFSYFSISLSTNSSNGVNETLWQIRINSLTVWSIVISLIVIFANWILKTIGNFKIKRFIKDIVTLVSLIVVLISFISLKGEYLNISLIERNYITEASLMPPLLLRSVLMLLLGNGKADVFFNNVGIWTIVIYVLFVTIIILFAFTLKNCINNTASSKKSYVTSLVLSIVNIFSTLAYLVFTIIFVESVKSFSGIREEAIKIVYTQPILLVIFAVVLLGLAIANIAIKNNEIEEE